MKAPGARGQLARVFALGVILGGLGGMMASGTASQGKLQHRRRGRVTNAWGTVRPTTSTSVADDPLEEESLWDEEEEEESIIPEGLTLANSRWLPKGFWPWEVCQDLQELKSNPWVWWADPTLAAKMDGAQWAILGGVCSALCWGGMWLVSGAGQGLALLHGGMMIPHGVGHQSPFQPSLPCSQEPPIQAGLPMLPYTQSLGLADRMWMGSHAGAFNLYQQSQKFSPQPWSFSPQGALPWGSCKVDLTGGFPSHQPWPPLMTVVAGPNGEIPIQFNRCL